MTTVPPGSAEKPYPKSLAQSRKLFSNDKIKTLTKLKVQEYINSFFLQSGENHDLLSLVSPRFINYNIDKSFDPATDPTQRRLQIARTFSELRAILPAILIVDGGVNTIHSSIGQIEKVIVKDGYWNGFYPIVKGIPLSIIAAARDMEEADEMAGVLSLMFNEMRNLAGGSFIAGNQDQGETWVIVLPQGPVNVSSLSDVQVEGDPVEQIFYSELVLDQVMFEDTIAVRKQLPEIKSIEAVVGNPSLDEKLAPVIEISDTIPLNSQTKLFVRNFSDDYRIILSDSRLATLSHNMVITPRGLGVFEIQVVDNKYSNSKPSKVIVASKTVEIVA